MLSRIEAAPRLTEDVLEDDAVVPQVLHQPGLLVDDAADAILYSVRAATVRNHFGVEAHAAIEIVLV
jgi:hypothetical protein